MPTRRLLRLPLILLLVLLLTGAAFVVWAGNPLGPSPAAQIALQTDGEVRVQNGDWLTFLPTGAEPDTGLIFYPGGRVDYRSYAPAARAIAAAGYLVVIPPMPLNMAFLDAGVASDIIAAYPHINAWAIGGHSLGGAMAASYARNNPGRMQGLVLWAAYPAPTDDLSAFRLAVASIYGSNDGLAGDGEIETSRSLLPADTDFVAIAGGNHAQFGAYGPQPGDGAASISAAEQQRQAVAATLRLLQQIAPQNSS